MSIFNSSMYSNFHEMNADFLLKAVKECQDYVKENEEKMKEIVNKFVVYDNLFEEFEDYPTFKTNTNNSISNINSSISNIYNRLTGYEDFKTTTNSDIANLNSDVNIISALIEDYPEFKTATNNSLSELREDLDEYIEGGIPQSFLDTLLAYVQENLPELLNPISQRIDTNASNIATNTSDISALTNRVATAEGNITSNSTNISTNTTDIAALTSRVETIEEGGTNVVQKIDNGIYNGAIVIPNTIYEVVLEDGTLTTEQLAWKPALLQIARNYFNGEGGRVQLGTYYQKIAIKYKDEDNIENLIVYGNIVGVQYTALRVYVDLFTDSGNHYKIVYNSAEDVINPIYYNLSAQKGITCRGDLTKTTTTAQKVPLTLHQFINDGDDNGGLSISDNGLMIFAEKPGLYEIELQAHTQSKSAGVYVMRYGSGISGSDITDYPAQSVYSSGSGQDIRLSATGVVRVTNSSGGYHSILVSQPSSSSHSWSVRVIVKKISDYIA